MRRSDTVIDGTQLLPRAGKRLMNVQHPPVETTGPAARQHAAPGALPRRSWRGPLLGLLASVLLPTALAGWYYYGIAADRYVTEFRFSVRGGALTQQSDEGLGGALGGSGALVYAGDSFVLSDYLHSLEAMESIERSLPLREMLGRDGGDPLRRFDPDAPAEDLEAFWRNAVRPRFDVVRGITTVEVSLFEPTDSLRVAEALVENLREIVDGLSGNARLELLAFANAEYERVSTELERARAAIEAFRRENRLITPTEQVSIGAEIIGALSSRLAEKHVELRSLIEQSPSSPRIAVVSREIESLQEQLEAEVSQRAGQAEAADADALPSQLTSFDELENAYLIARDTYVATVQLRQQAEAAAALRRAELVVFVPPRLAKSAIEPNRPLALLKVFGATLALWVIGRVLWASFRTG